jgi:homocysteine S-methyltransferase
MHGDELHPAEAAAPSITVELRQVARLAQGDAFDAVCVMHTDVYDVEEVLALVGETWEGPVGVYPHRGVWQRPSWQFVDLPAGQFAQLARGWRAAGVSMIGGCCGIGPTQIAALAQL